MIYDENVIQDIPIIEDKELEPLMQVEFEMSRGKDPNTYTTKLNLYTASDGEFMQWLAKITKTKKEELLADVGFGDGWTNANRLRIRLELVKRSQESITSYLKTVDNK